MSDFSYFKELQAGLNILLLHECVDLMKNNARLLINQVIISARVFLFDKEPVGKQIKIYIMRYIRFKDFKHVDHHVKTPNCMREFVLLTQ